MLNVIMPSVVILECCYAEHCSAVPFDDAVTFKITALCIKTPILTIK
jgi:hypothetical protein